MKEKYVTECLDDVYLAGFMYNSSKKISEDHGRFNFVLNNGAKSEQNLP
jgi:hypothetical protein